MAIQLQGAVVCVTGAARGIGFATAEALAKKGATVWMGDIDTEAVAAAAKRIGAKAKAVHLDVTNAESFAAFINAANQDGPISLLVNNAGIMRTGAFIEQDLAGQSREIAINLTGVLTGMHLVLPQMLRRNIGHIVNLSSMAGLLSVPGAAVYTATKFAVTGASRAIRAEIIDSNITISCIHPSAVRTELTDGLDIRGVPTVAPSEVANVIIESCATGQAEITLPRWVKPVGVMEAAIPERAAGFIKKLVGAQKRITADNEKRRTYKARA